MSQLGHYQLGYIETLSHWNQKEFKKIEKKEFKKIEKNIDDKGNK